jgi:hypothetical protein
LSVASKHELYAASVDRVEQLRRILERAERRLDRLIGGSWGAIMCRRVQMLALRTAPVAVRLILAALTVLLIA